MNFTDFQNSRHFVDDVDNGTGEPQRGYMYTQGLYIEECNEPDCKYHLMLFRDSYCSNDLYGLECRLYLFALDNDYFNEVRMRDAWVDMQVNFLANNPDNIRAFVENISKYVPISTIIKDVRG